MNALKQLLADNPSTELGVKKAHAFFMAHMIAGYPNMKVSEKVAKALVSGGADIIELQIPFSDPMADGPTIAIASEDALKAGCTVQDALTLLSKVEKLGKPIAVMSYMNPIYRMGIEKFVKKIAQAGASALIVPDCPFDSEEGELLLAAGKIHDVYIIPVVSPGVPKERLKQLAKNARLPAQAGGFVYCTSRQGITGATSKFSGDLKKFVGELKRIFKLPVAVGFGVKSRADVKSLSKIADIVIAGSVFVNAVKQGSNIEKLVVQLTRKK